MDVSEAAPNGSVAADPRLWVTPTETAALPDSGLVPPARQVVAGVDPDLFGPGRPVGGRYQLVNKLGHGGMGTVWKAHDTVIDRDVAVKEPRVPAAVPDGDRMVVFARLEREARAAAQVDHPSVVTIYDVVSENGQPWIVMELIKGRSLADILDEGTLAPAEAARIALSVTGALAAAHACKVVHRDVKPSNVMLASCGRIVLTDFGIAHIDGEAPVTRTGTVVGSADYTAPERVLGRVPGPESDLFALGVLLYSAVEGFSPFWRQTRYATFQAVLHAEPPTPRQAGDLAGLILRLLNKDPAARPMSAEIVSALDRVAGPACALNRGAIPVKRQAGSGAAHHKWMYPAVSALTAVVVAGGAVATVMWPGPTAGGTSGRTTASISVPAGWKMVHKLGVSLAVPANYEAYDLYDHGGGVAFQVKRGR
ncbi:serine/threonine-protein kinase [Nocardia brevicatena]|uniref:serine/threonine-protein kinase n=1 Tax=Nocardia brevicatena TaxID=37327 RepID=UPI000A04E184|nr:serine/threonine-protein kinase [Nocardia brevicatena]